MKIVTCYEFAFVVGFVLRKGILSCLTGSFQPFFCEGDVAALMHLSGSAHLLHCRARRGRSLRGSETLSVLRTLCATLYVAALPSHSKAFAGCPSTSGSMKEGSRSSGVVS